MTITLSYSSLRYLSKLASHSERSTFTSLSVSMARVFLQLPITGMSTGTFLPISEGSMSRCITLACLAYVERSPVTLSSNLIPTAMSTSHSLVLTLLHQLPCIPSMPLLRGWEDGITESPSKVQPNGSAPFSTKALNSSWASPSSMPCPASTNGLLAEFMAAAASRILVMSISGSSS